MDKCKFINLISKQVYETSDDGTRVILKTRYTVGFSKEGDFDCFSSEDLLEISDFIQDLFSDATDDQMALYHCTTPKKAKLYRETGAILKPVRGFTTLQAAMAWCIHTGRTVIYEIKGGPAYKLPDHHNKFGEAWWIDENIPIDRIKAVRFDLPLHKCGEVKEEENGTD